MIRLSSNIKSSDKRIRIGKKENTKSRFSLQKTLTIATFATLPFLTVGCSAPEGSVENPCEVRVYNQQVLLKQSNTPSNLKSGGVPSVAGNSIILQQFIWNDLWLIKDYVRVKQFHPFAESKTTEYEKISADTTFLIVGVDDPLTFQFEGQKYFDGRYSHLDIDTVCPIYTGQRNGKFALATVRTIGGSHDELNRRKTCDIYATLAFFGVSKEDLESYENYVEVDIFGPEYDRYAIRNYLETRKSCGGDSLKNLRVAAEDGNAKAQYELGALYLSGAGGVVAMDQTSALKWIQLAANQEHAEAQALLGDIYNSSIDGDFVKAAKWYRLAARQGVERAQFNLAQMYAVGEGVEKDYVQSYLWISIVSKTDPDNRLSTMIKTLSELMTEEQITQAKLLASKCVQSNYLNCE